MNGKLIILTGPSGSGKDTIRAELLKKYPQASKLITVTTRKPRDGEINGVNYHFVNKETFLQMKNEGQFLEDVEYAGNLYGTTKKAIEEILAGKTVLWQMDVLGASRIKEMIKKAFDVKKAEELIKRTSIIYIYTSDSKDVYERLSQRGESNESIQDRLEQDKKDLYLKDNFENIVENKNGDLDKTIAEVINLIN